MFQDHKVANSGEGDTHEEESKSTVTFEAKTNDNSMIF